MTARKGTGKRKVMKKKAAAKKDAATRVPPVAKRYANEVDAASLDRIGQPREAHIALEGPANIEVDQIEVIPSIRGKSKMEVEAFMAQEMRILIHNSPEKHAENPVQLGVNGRMCLIFRNQETIIKRKYVAQLCKARAEGVEQEPGNPDPKIANKLNITAGLRYPFTVLEDPSPLGGEWLRRECAQA